MNAKIGKCTYLHKVYFTICEIYSPLPSNKTAQRSSQQCTKLHNVVQNVLHSKSHQKIVFSLCFGFLTRAKNKAYILNGVFKLLVGTNRFIKVRHNYALFVALSICTFYLKLCSFIKFYLQVKDISYILIYISSM